MIGLCLFGINFVVLSIITMIVNFIIYWKLDIMIDPHQTMCNIVLASYSMAIIMANHYGV